MFLDVALEGNNTVAVFDPINEIKKPLSRYLYLHLRQLGVNKGFFLIRHITGQCDKQLRRPYYDWLCKWHFKLLHNVTGLEELIWQWHLIFGNTIDAYDFVTTYITVEDIRLVCNAITDKLFAPEEQYPLYLFRKALLFLLEIAVPNITNSRELVDLLHPIHRYYYNLPKHTKDYKTYKTLYKHIKAFILRVNDPCSILKFATQINKNDEDIDNALKNLSLQDLMNNDLSFGYLTNGGELL